MDAGILPTIPPRARVGSIDARVDPEIPALSVAAIKEDLATNDWSKNKAWEDLRLRLVKCQFNPGMVNAALKAADEYGISHKEMELVGVYRFYHIILTSGKSGAYEVVTDKVHIDMLFATSQQTSDSTIKGSLLQYVADWIHMFDGNHDAQVCGSLAPVIPPVDPLRHTTTAPSPDESSTATPTLSDPGFLVVAALLRSPRHVRRHERS